MSGKASKGSAAMPMKPGNMNASHGGMMKGIKGGMNSGGKK